MERQHKQETPSHILLVEDTPALLTMYETALKNDGFDVTCKANGRDALSYLEDNRPDLLLVDLRLPDMDGLKIIRTLNERNLHTPVIVITGHGSVNTAIDAMRHGARDFLVKPFNIDRLCSAVRSELEKDPTQTMPHELAGLTGMVENSEPTEQSYERTGHTDSFGGFIGTSPIMQKIYEQIESAAKSNATVFITGESGTGKEVCAEAIHKHSARADKPFIPINCAAIPRDLMESELFGHVKGAFTGAIAERDGAARLANGGTLFLDEIAEMNPDMQTKLLRFLQNFTFQKVGGSKAETTDARIICATNRNPVEEIKAGHFREDLFYRLHVLPIYMPPLKDRGSDIIDIAETLLRRYTDEEKKKFERFSPEAEDVLRHYEWPGNVRQLQNVIRNIVVMHDGPDITMDMLPPSLPGSMAATHAVNDGSVKRPSAQPVVREYGEDVIRPLAEIEKEAIERAIEICGGNIPQAAAALGLSPSTIYRKKTAWEK